MGGISIWQVAILLLMLGTPVLMYFVVSGRDKTSIRRPRAYLQWSFWLYVTAIVAIVVAAVGFAVYGALSGAEMEAPTLLIAPIGFTFFLSGMTFLVSLGLLASRTGRSVVVWVGLTIIGGPIGVLVSFILMLDRARDVSAN